MPRATPSAIHSDTAWRRVGGLRLREVRYRPGGSQPRHRHPSPGISLVLSGSLEEESSSASVRASAGHLAIKPADSWHADRYGPRGAHLVQIEPAAAGQHLPALGLQYSWSPAPRLVRSVLALLYENKESHRAEAAELEFWDALARLEIASDQRRDRSPPAWWPAALELLSAAATRSVSVGSIAGEVGVHPVYFARVCRRQLGSSVMDYLGRQRVLAAWRACERGGGSLAEIALATGFSDQAHMSRSFRRVLGVTPASLRRLL